MAQIHRAVLRLLQIQVAGDEHLPLNHDVPVLEQGTARVRLDVLNDAVRPGHHVGGGFLVQQLRLLVPLPHHHLRPGAVDVDGQIAQLRQAPQGVVCRLQLPDGGAVGAGTHPHPMELGQDDGGGDGVVARHLDDQQKPGQKAHRQKAERQPRQKAPAPLHHPLRHHRRPPATRLPQLAHGPLGQTVQTLSVPKRHAEGEAGLVQPAQLPELEPVLGAQVQKPLGEGPGGMELHIAPQKVNEPLHRLTS